MNDYEKKLRNLMAMNRKDRRAQGKLNGIKIKGTNNDHEIISTSTETDRPKSS